MRYRFNPNVSVLTILSVIAALLIATSSVSGEIPSPQPIAGVSGGAIGEGNPSVAADHTLSLRRAVFEPNGYVSMHHHPGALILYVESGELSYKIEEGEVEVVRAGTVGEGTPPPTESYGPGDTLVLGAGDWLFEEGVIHDARNTGSEPAVVWLSALVESGVDFTQFHSGM